VRSLNPDIARVEREGIAAFDAVPLERRRERLRRPAAPLGVERTLSWFGRNRRFGKDFENLAETLATFFTLASIRLALRRLARA
jgi:hypothetical protein